MGIRRRLSDDFGDLLCRPKLLQKADKLLVPSLLRAHQYRSAGELRIVRNPSHTARAHPSENSPLSEEIVASNRAGEDDPAVNVGPDDIIDISGSSEGRIGQPQPLEQLRLIRLGRT